MEGFCEFFSERLSRWLDTLRYVKATVANVDTVAVAQQATEAAVNGPGQPSWAIFLSAAAIIIAAAFGAWWQRRIARQTLTINTIERQLWDGDYIETRAKFIKARDSKTTDALRNLASKENAQEDEAAAMRTILNNYELLSLGIVTGVLDEAIYKRYFRKTFTTDYELSKPFIQGVRDRSPRAYKEYTALYEKWRENGTSGN